MRAVKAALSRLDMNILAANGLHGESLDRIIDGNATWPRDRMEALRHFLLVLGQIRWENAVRLGLLSVVSK